MNDEQMANIARRLARALMLSVHDHSDVSRKEIATLKTELCAAYRQERRAAQEPEPWASSDASQPDFNEITHE